MRIKMKLSFEALKHGQTVIEFMISAILKTYIELHCPESEESDDELPQKACQYEQILEL